MDATKNDSVLDQSKKTEITNSYIVIGVLSGAWGDALVINIR